MVLSTSQQVALAFTAVLFTFVVLPRLFGVGGGSNGAKDARHDPRYNRKGPGPGAARGTSVHMNSPGAQSAENMQNMKKLMEQELKSDKYKSNNSKGYVFTLMPLYAIGVGVFAAYKFLKIKSADDQAQKEKLAKGAKKSVEAENQLNELEQRLAQTERMLNSILTQLDPLTNCVKSVAQEQKNEIMNQLQTIRFLMKKRGMDCPPLNVQALESQKDTPVGRLCDPIFHICHGSCERNLDNLIESLGAKESTHPRPMQPISEEAPADEQDPGDKTAKTTEDEEEDAAMERREEPTKENKQEGAGLERAEAGPEEEAEDDVPLSEDSGETETEDTGVEPVSGLRRRIRPE